MDDDLEIETSKKEDLEMRSLVDSFRVVLDVTDDDDALTMPEHLPLTRQDAISHSPPPPPIETHDLGDKPPVAHVKTKRKEARKKKTPYSKKYFV